MGLSPNFLLVNLGTLVFHGNTLMNCFRTVRPQGLNFQDLGQRSRPDKLVDNLSNAQDR